MLFQNKLEACQCNLRVFEKQVTHLTKERAFKKHFPITLQGVGKSVYQLIMAGDMVASSLTHLCTNLIK